MISTPATLSTRDEPQDLLLGEIANEPKIEPSLNKKKSTNTNQESSSTHDESFDSLLGETISEIPTTAKSNQTNPYKNK